LPSRGSRARRRRRPVAAAAAAAVVKGQQMQARLFRVAAAAVGNLLLSFSLQLFNLFWPLSRIWWSSTA